MVILQKRVAGLSSLGLGRFVAHARRAAGLRGAVNVLVTNSSEMRSLNARFRGKNTPTDVLSFRAEESGLAGDIAISAEIASANARTLGHPVSQEIKILVLHGILHLRGFDHERDNGTMARRERQLRRALCLPVGLIERTTASRSKSRSRSRP